MVDTDRQGTNALRWPGLLCVVVVVLAALSMVTANAEHLVYDTAEECMQSDYSDPFDRPACTNYGDGKWRASHPRDPASEARNVFATFAVIWVFLVAGSVWWVVSTARKHGDPIGTALFGALVGGPIFVLMYGSNSDLVRRSRKLYRWTDRLPEDPSSAGADAREPDTATRLRELGRLRDEGLITEDEYATRRSVILDEV